MRRTPFHLLEGVRSHSFYCSAQGERERRFLLYLLMAIIGLGIFGVLRITDPGRALEQYGDSVTPVIQRHLDAYHLLGLEGGRVYEQALSSTVTLESLGQLRGLVDFAANDMFLVMEEWAVIAPPPKAQSFHKLVFDAMDLRYQAALDAVAFLDFLGQSGNPDIALNPAIELMDLANEQFTNSDLMWTHIIVSSVSLKVDTPR